MIVNRVKDTKKINPKRISSILIMLVFWVIFALNVQGQSLWPIRAGGDQPDSGQSVAYSIDDHVFVTGTYETSVSDTAIFGDLGVTFTSTPSGARDIYVGKLTELGSWLWTATVGGLETDISYGIAVDEYENAYITGSFSGTLVFLNADGSASPLTLAATRTQFFVAMLDKDGQWLWAHTTIASNGESTGRNIAAFSGVNGVASVYVCGEFSGDATFGSHTLSTGATQKSGFVVMMKGDAWGSFKWAQKIGGSGESEILDIAVGKGTSSEDGNNVERPFVYLTGSFNQTVSFGSIGKSSAGGKDVFLAKMQDNSDMYDDLTVEKNNLEQVLADAEDALDDSIEYLDWIGLRGNCRFGTYYCFIVVGWFNLGCQPLICAFPRWVYNSTYVAETLDTTMVIQSLRSEIHGYQISLGVIDGLLAEGRMSWGFVSTAGSPLEDIGFGVAFDRFSDPGYIFITGEFQSTAVFSPWASSVNSSDYPMSAYGSTDIFVAKTDMFGKFLWAKSAGVDPSANLARPTSVNSIAVDITGSAFIVGSISDETTFGELELVATNSDFVDQLLGQLSLATERLAEITTPGVTAYGHYALYKAKYILTSLGFSPSEFGPWDGGSPYRLSASPDIGLLEPNEYILSKIGNPYVPDNEVEEMLDFVFGTQNWQDDLVSWTDGNKYNGELNDFEIQIDASGNINNMIWERDLANSRHILTEMGYAPTAFLFDTLEWTKDSIVFDLVVIRNLLPSVPAAPTVAQITAGGEWLNGDCTDDELISVQFVNVDNSGSGDFLWNYISTTETPAELLVDIEPSVNLCTTFGSNTWLSKAYDFNHFSAVTLQANLALKFATIQANAPSGGAWTQEFADWTDGDTSGNKELQATDALIFIYDPVSETANVTFYFTDTTNHVVPFTLAGNPYQTITHTVSSADTTLDPGGYLNYTVSQGSPTQDCPDAFASGAPCIWELYDIFQQEADQLETTINDLQSQITSLNNNTQPNQDAMLAKILTDGNWARATAGGGPLDDIARDVVSGANGRIFVTGSFQTAAILGGLSPVVATGNDPDNGIDDVDAFIAGLDSFLFGAFKRWVIGKEVRPPAIALDPATNAPYGAPVGIYDGVGELVMDAFFWLDAELPENRKLFAIAPGSYVIQWSWELYGQNVPYLGLDDCPTGWADLNGDCYDPASGVAPAIYGPEQSTGISEWPSDPQIHIAGTPVDLNPPVNLDPSQPEYLFHSLRYSHHDTMVLDNVFTNPEPDTYSVILYMQALSPSRIEVVYTIAFEESPDFGVGEAIIGNRITSNIHQDNAGKNGYILSSNARYDAEAYQVEDRTGPIIPVNTIDDPYGQYASIHTNPNPSPMNPTLINGSEFFDDDLLVVWYKTNEIGVAWSEVPVWYTSHWPSSKGRVLDFAIEPGDVTPDGFSDAFDFALDLKNGGLFYTDISLSQIMRTDTDGSRSTDTASLLNTLSLIPGSPSYDLNSLNADPEFSHNLINDQILLDILIPQLPTGAENPDNWRETFTEWGNNLDPNTGVWKGHGDTDGELVNIIVSTTPNGDSAITWYYEESTHVTDMLLLFSFSDPFFKSTALPASIDFNSLLGASNVNTFLRDSGNMEEFLLHLPTGVTEPNWEFVLGKWTDADPAGADPNGELVNVTLDVSADGSADLEFHYQVNSGGIQDKTMVTHIDGEGGFSRTLVSAISGPRVLVSKGLIGPKSIDLDLVDGEGKIYWTDSTARKIQRSNLDGTNVETLIETRIEEPVGLVLDTVSANSNQHRMYWSDPSAKTICRAFLHHSRQQMTHSVLDLFKVAMGTYDLNEIYGQTPDAPYAGINPDDPPYSNTYSDSWGFLSVNKSDLANLLSGLAYELDGSPVTGLLNDFDTWTNGNQVIDYELENIQINNYGSGTSELHFLLNQNSLITTLTYHVNQEDIYTLLTFFLEHMDFSMNTVFGEGFSYEFVRDAMRSTELIAALPSGITEPDWSVLFQNWTDGDPATGTMGDIYVVINNDGSTSFSVDYTDSNGVLQIESSVAGLAIGAPSSHLISVFFNRARVYDLDLIAGNGRSYELLSQKLDEIEALLLPIGFSNTYAYRIHENEVPGFFGNMLSRWSNGTFDDGELSSIVITVATDGSSKITWQYDVEDGYELYETIIPGFEEIIGTDVGGPTRMAIDLTDFDPVNHMVYWVDMVPGQNRIQRSYLDGRTGAEELVTDIVSPSGITLFDNKLYWSDYVTREIYKANLNGTYMETFNFGGPYNAPKAINITTYTTSAGTLLKDSVLNDAGIDKIVIASQLGSEGLNQPILYPTIFPELSLYFQNDPALVGFNPNDEHADFFPSTIGSGQDSIFALRDDLTKASEPYVLLKHRSLVDNDWTMKVYQVIRNGFGYDFSELNGVAGNPFFAPYPVRLMGTCSDTSGKGEPYFEDYKFNTYAKSAGKIVARFFYPLQTGFYWDESEFGPIKDGGCVSWLGGDIYDINELLPSEFLFTSSHEKVKLDLGMLVSILPAGSDQPDWFTLLSAWTNQSFSSTQDGLIPDPDSDGELEAFAIEVYKNGQSRITWTYAPDGITLDGDGNRDMPLLEMNTFIESDSATQQILNLFLFSHGFSDLNEKYISPMEVTYNIRWPDVPPVLTVGETLLFPKNGLPDIFNQASVKVIYEGPDGTEENTPRSLVNLIDPISAREVQLVNAELPSLPQDVATENQEGKLVIVSNASGTTLVPFSLRSRLSFDPVSGKLAFSGYLDTTVAGEPILLVNVLSANERDFLKSLSTVTAFHNVIDDLYDFTRNPNQLDLDGDSVPDQKYLLGLDEIDGVIQPQSLVGLPKGLTAGAADSTGWVTLVFNDDSRLNPLPVSLNVFRVDCLEYSPNRFSPYIGEVKIIQSNNIFDEQLTLRHSGDFGGNPFDDLNGNGIQDPGEFGLFFEWYYKPDENGVSPPPPEFSANGDIIPGSGWRPFDSGLGLQEITIEGANLTTLSDNWFFVRYKGYPICRNDFEFTQLAGDPSSTPTHPRGVLAEGWIKRVIRRLNAFEARVQDFHAAPTNTFASMIGQLGERYEGPIAMNNDPNNINAMGLIEAYETVLQRGMSLSIDGTPPINYGPANKALLLVANRIAGFYSLLGNEAYSDALDPTIGFDTESELGYVAPTLFAFQNQQSSLLAEELTLLRGRDDYSAGVAASPVYNRLYWNFTSGDGEVAYVQAYNIHDQNISGVIDETDARILFPQGHGDAWGHYLTSLNTFYKLLTHPYYTWEPRAEAVTVAGVAIQVDYEDERRFAEVAAQKAKAGARIVNMTYREKYVADPAGQWQGYKDTNESRAWGLSGWAKRAGQGTYLDWVVANSILPVEDLNNTGLEKIDRTSVVELRSIVSEFGAIQRELDKADSGNNPLGLAKGAIAFDIDPSEIDEGKTHFEQIYERAIGNLANALFVFDQANELSNILRRNQDTVDDFTGNIYDQDYDFMSRLIEIFGYPYEGDIGPGGTYPNGYDGPDIYHFNYVDYERLTGENLGRIETWTTAIDNQDEMTTWLGDWWDASGLDGSFRDDPVNKWTNHLRLINEVTYHFVDNPPVAYVNSAEPPEPPSPPPEGMITFHDYYHQSNTTKIGLVKPDPSWGERRANGEIQVALSELIQEIASMDASLNEYDRHIDTMMGTITDIEQRYKFEIARSTRQWVHFGLVTAVDAAIAISKVIRIFLRTAKTFAEETVDFTKESLPKTVGTAVDTFFAVRAAAETVGGGIEIFIDMAHDGFETAEDLAAMAKETYGMAKDIELEDLSAKHELGVFIREFEAQVRMEPGLRLDLYLQLDIVKSKVAAYHAAVAKGNRLIDEMIVFRKNAAAATQDYRYRDMFFRIMRNDALQKYHAQFDLAAKYVYLAASAYDYETNLLGTNEMAGRDFLTNIVKQRNLGELMWSWEGVLVPLPGRAGLADPMARMKANFDVLKPQLGFNNPQIETNRFSMREQLFRITPGNNQAWQDELTEHRVADIWRIPEFKRFCRPFAPQEQGPQPGIVIPFSTNVTSGLNYFGWPLGSGDSAYDPSHFATRIRSVGVWFTGYDGLNLSQTPRVYLVPAGMDVLRSPDATNFDVREWQLVDQKLPMALPLTIQDVEAPDWIPIQHSLSDDIFDIRQFSAFRAYDDSGGFEPDEVTTDSRLIGRSVWNTRWLLIIPGRYMLSDEDAALDAFVSGVSDINFFFETYAYSGSKKTEDAETKDINAGDEATEQLDPGEEVPDDR